MTELATYAKQEEYLDRPIELYPVPVFLLVQLFTSYADNRAACAGGDMG